MKGLESLFELAKSRVHNKVWEILIGIYPKTKRNESEVKYPIMELSHKITNAVINELLDETFSIEKKDLTNQSYFAILLMMKQLEKDFLYCIQKADHYWKLSKRMLEIASSCVENSNIQTPNFNIEIDEVVFKKFKRYLKADSNIEVKSK